ncbi:hypothetical protein PCH_Pc22g17580 [Penicillium rubens Wisconsin 54-1255]|jgi:hypothetical protein|uniref:Uncharacterized protein n=1 Tax=Penicillium rubens (strain ATCC 28089 / DSM 1075 / NRRL 1951 / Wisconsin 54-1255) TaxID=500485 RepID=B6HT82_PENRW|nr:hypothetical protein PCH_Pc22g17580 [Penicillium rubens Wisconsin 54-1255]
MRIGVYHKLIVLTYIEGQFILIIYIHRTTPYYRYNIQHELFSTKNIISEAWPGRSTPLKHGPPRIRHSDKDDKPRNILTPEDLTHGFAKRLYIRWRLPKQPNIRPQSDDFDNDLYADNHQHSNQATWK